MKQLLAAIWVIGLSAVLVAGIPTIDHPEEETKVAVVVLDAADWEPINQLREKDRVPNIEDYRQNGVHGTLVTPRAFSPITWTKIATGRDEHNIGIKGWNTEDNGQRRMVRREDIENKRLWDYLNAANKTTGVAGWIITWPVEKVNGFMTAGPMRTSNTDLYYPEEEFTQEEKNIIRDGSEWEVADMAIERKDKLDFVAVGMKTLDVKQHHLWKYVEPEAFGMERKEENDKYREFIYTEYENLDRVMGSFDDDWNVIVVGDSGFNPENQEFGFVSPSYALSVNPIIERLGYGQFKKERVGGTTIDVPVNNTKIQRCPLIYPMGDIINKTTIRFRMCIQDSSLDVDKLMQDFQEIEYRDGRKLISEMNYRQEENDIIAQMRIYEDGIVEKKLKQESTDQPLVDGPVPFIDPALGLTLPGGEKMKLWIGPEKNGDHPPGTDSIFMAKGPAFKQGYDAGENISAVDITPTVLYMYGLPVPEQMEGRPALEIFNEEFREERTLEIRNISTAKQNSYDVETDEERNRALKKRLREIGYIVG